MNNLLNKSQAFLKKHSPIILTCVGAVGTIATTVTAVKATPKAILLLDDAKKEKGEELTKLETVKIAGPAYVPTAILGVSTLACIFGANMLNHRTQASIMSAYALIDNGYKDFRKKVDEVYGEEAGGQVRAGIAKDKYEESSVKVTDNDKRLYFDYYSNRYFEAKPFDVQKAEYELNRTLMMDDGVCLNDWYKLIDIEPLEHGEDFGWSTSTNMDAYWQTWIDFRHEKTTMDDGLECIIITFAQEPYPEFYEWY